MGRRFCVYLVACAVAILLIPSVAFCRLNIYSQDGDGGADDFVYSENAYQHIYERMDKYQTTGNRLIEGESEPYTSGQQYTAWTYDNALSIIALVARGNPEDKTRARLLCNTLIWVQNNDPYYTDGRLRDGYWANNINTNGKASVKADNTSAGNMAWIIIAWLYYYNHSGDSDQAFRQQILNAATTLGNFIENRLWASVGPYPGYLIGYTGWAPNQTLDPYIKSTEHNADLYVAFKRLYEATNDSNWLSRAAKAQTFVYAMYNYSQHRFYVGTTSFNTINDNPQALDANTMPILAFRDSTPLSWIESNCHLLSDGFEGFDFNNDHDGIWFEGTGQMAVAYQTLGRFADSDKYKRQLRLAQTSAINGNGKGIVSASRDYLTTGFAGWWYFRTMSIAPTCWFIFVERGLNPFS